MSTTPAAQLAHLRRVHGERWRIETSEPDAATRVYIAAERATGRKIVTQNLADLEQRLERTERFSG